MGIQTWLKNTNVLNHEDTTNIIIVEEYLKYTNKELSELDNEDIMNIATTRQNFSKAMEVYGSWLQSIVELTRVTYANAR